MPDEVDNGEMLEGLERRSKDLRPLLSAIGFAHVGKTQAAFRTQGREGIWPPRTVPNVAGIVGDLAAGREPPPRRFQPRPAGIDTGRLMGSIDSRVTGPDTVEVGSTVEYASRVQFGGVSAIAVTDAVRRNLTSLLLMRPDLAPKLSFLFRVRTFTVRSRPRPFLVLTEADVAEYALLAADYMARGTGGG